MPISRGQMPRQMYGLGSLVKSITKGVKSAVSGVKDVLGSDLGKAALLIGGGMIPFGQTGTSLFGRMASSPILSGILESKAAGKIGGVLKDVAIGTGVAGLTDYLTRPDELPKKIGGRSTQEINQVVSQMKENYRNLGYEEGEIDLLIEDFVQQNYPGYNRSEGGRIGFAGGTEFEEYLKGKEKFDKQQNYEQLYREFLENKRRQKVAEQKTMAANGGRIGYAFGNDPEQNAVEASGIMNLPLNQNPAGATELDLRETGGFIPPVGVKEKEDDIPAMLSNNEFVFTADAVRGMGDGDVNKGAQRMYDMMKKLEGGGRV